jgi:hypothetical protein
MMSQMLQTVAQFSGVAIENTLLHLRQFMEMVSIIQDSWDYYY